MLSYRPARPGCGCVLQWPPALRCRLSLQASAAERGAEAPTLDRPVNPCTPFSYSCLHTNMCLNIFLITDRSPTLHIYIVSRYLDKTKNTSSISDTLLIGRAPCRPTSSLCCLLVARPALPLPGSPIIAGLCKISHIVM